MICLITYIRTAEKRLVPLPGNPEVIDDEYRAFRTFHLSQDGEYEVGLIDFQGDCHEPSQDGYEGTDGYEDTLVIIEGSVEIETDGTKYSLTTGDVIVFETPFGERHISSPDGFKAAWVVRHREHNEITERRETRAKYLEFYGAE